MTMNTIGLDSDSWNKLLAGTDGAQVMEPFVTFFNKAEDKSLKVIVIIFLTGAAAVAADILPRAFDVRDGRPALVV